MGPPQISFFTYYIWGPHQISFFTYYMGPPSDLFLFILSGGPLESLFSSHTIWWPPQIIFFLHIIWGPLKSVSSHTIWGRLDFAYYVGAPLRSISSHTIWVSLIWSYHFLRILYGASLRSVSSHTICFSHTTWGPAQISFFAYYSGPTHIFFFAYDMGPHQSTFFAYNIGILVRLVSQYMPIAIVMKMRKMFYFYISMDCVKIGCFLNNIVVIAQKNISSTSKWRLNHCTSFWFQASGFFSKQKFGKISPIPEHWKIQSFL